MTFDPLALLLITLAAWRVAVLLVREDGPFGCARWLRERTGIVHDADGEPVGIPDGNPLGCVFCTSMYTSAILMGVWLVAPVLVVWLAVAGGVMLLERAVTKNG